MRNLTLRSTKTLVACINMHVLLFYSSALLTSMCTYDALLIQHLHNFLKPATLPLLPT